MNATSFIKIITCTSLLLLVMCKVVAQTARDTLLNEVNVHSKHKVSNDARVNEFSPGQKVKAIDSATLQQYQLQSTARLLSQQEPVFVKSYGFNGLATLGFRGASAAQSAVLWNGVPIQNAALGVADISTLPVMLMSKMNIVYGGSSALWGSGNVGGALLLENESPVFDTNRKSLSVCTGAGSFDQYMGGLKGSLSTKKLYFSISAFGQSALNNISYVTQSGTHTNMQNDHLQSGSLMLHGAVNLSADAVINFYLWLQQYNRQVPPALFETFSDKKQDDGSARFLFDLQKKLHKGMLFCKFSYIEDKLAYSDNAILLHSTEITNQVYVELGWKMQFHEYGQLLLFAPGQISGISHGYQQKDTAQQHRIALAGAYEVKMFKSRLDVAINARGEIIDSLPVFLPGANAYFILTNWLAVRANVQRTYRTPTLNELYYNPGGNAGLKPEQGWSEDAGYTVKAKLSRFTFYHDLSVFDRDIHDWIIWLGGAIWTPHNIAEVHSRGVETENNITWSAGKWKLYFGVNTAYVLSTTVASYIYNDGSIGKQIPYTPRYNGQVNAGFTYRQFSFNYNHTYTGYRFTTTDESSYLLPYQTGNVQLMYSPSIHEHAWQFTAQCNNIWNEQYQVVAFRPMPGINWLIGFKVGLL